LLECVRSFGATLVNRNENPNVILESRSPAHLTRDARTAA
jgi:hypothetical protein